VLVSMQVQWLIATVLIASRLAVLLFMTPLFSLARIPVRIMVVLTVVFAAGINNCIEQFPQLVVTSAFDFFSMLVREIWIGLLMAFGVHCAFSAFSFAGRILDLQIGFGVANLVNPSTNEQSPLLGMALMMVGVMTFFLLQGHHWFLRAVIQSYTWFPLGGSWPPHLVKVIAHQFGLMFSFGVALVAPVIVILLLIDGAMAIAVRTMPQVNIFMLSIPVKIAVGLLVLASSLPLMRNVFQRIFATIFSYWAALA
jgi:flagellar biosynthesis protein FliR